MSGLYVGAVTSLANGLKTVWTLGRFDPERVMQIIEGSTQIQQINIARHAAHGRAL